MKYFRYTFEYIVFRFILFLFSIMSYERALRTGGKIIGRIAWKISPKHRNLVLKNIQTAMPHLTEEEITNLAKLSYESIARIVHEFIQLKFIDASWLDEYVEWEPSGVRAFEKSIKQKHGITLIMGHIGAWEIIAHILSIKFNVIINVVAARLSNPFANNYVMRERTRLGAKIVHPGSAGPALLEGLKRGEVSIFVSDQNAGKKGIFIPFLNQPASTHTGAALYSYLGKSDIFFVVVLRKPDGKFRIELVPMGNGREKNISKDKFIVKKTSEWVDILEKYVNKYPEQYFWMHNRWKTKPGPEDKIHKRIKTKFAPSF